jgi:hypothetical protein
LSCATGWTWEHIDNHVTLLTLEGFAEYWREAPPVGELVAAWLGAQSKSSAPKGEDIGELLSMMPRT